MTAATLYDGATAYPHQVRVEAEGERLVLVTDEGDRLPLDPGLLTRAEGDGARLRLGRSDRPGWRLTLDGPADPAVEALLPGGGERYGRWIDRLGLGKAALAFAGVAAVVLAVGYTAPAWLAPLVPEQWERNLGTALVGDFGDNRCRSPAGERALAALAERVEPGATAAGEHQVKLAALDIGIFNAAALPGANIIVFKGALEEGGPHMDAMAGIMAHELAHVRRRHVTQALIRELGIGALIRLFAGGIGANAETLVSLSYTRANEAEADGDAIAMLRRAAIDPRPTAALFAKLAREQGDGEDGWAIQFLDSHPGTSSRAARFAASYDARASYRPALADGDARALASACGKQPKTAG